MWDDHDREQLAKEGRGLLVHRSRREIEEIVVMSRLHLYNRGLHCGPKAIRKKMFDEEFTHPMPSERTIARILARNGLTHGRTGFYGEEAPEDQRYGLGDGKTE